MRPDIPELLFASRIQFRTWLRENAETSAGVWLVFGKTEDVVTVSANDALEEALCFGWIDGQVKSIDGTKYLKYFAKRRPKSVWSEKNKRTVGRLRDKRLMTEPGEKAVMTAIRNGTWNASEKETITDEHVEAFAERFAGISPAYENFKKMSRSVRFTYARRYYSFRTEEARERDLERIVIRLNGNLGPM